MRKRANASRRMPRIVGCAAVVALVLAGACGLGGEEMSHAEAARLTEGGNAKAGRQKLRDYGCGTCHTIPGVRGAHALVGPPLAGIAGRMYIAGKLTNTPQHMIAWIQDPPAIDSATAMPRVGVTKDDARDIAAYLYTLK